MRLSPSSVAAATDPIGGGEDDAAAEESDIDCLLSQTPQPLPDFAAAAATARPLSPIESSPPSLIHQPQLLPPLSPVKSKASISPKSQLSTTAASSRVRPQSRAVARQRSASYQVTMTTFLPFYLGMISAICSVSNFNLHHIHSLTQDSSDEEAGISATHSAGRTRRPQRKQRGTKSQIILPPPPSKVSNTAGDSKPSSRGGSSTAAASASGSKKSKKAATVERPPPQPLSSSSSPSSANEDEADESDSPRTPLFGSKKQNAGGSTAASAAGHSLTAEESDDSASLKARRQDAGRRESTAAAAAAANAPAKKDRRRNSNSNGGGRWNDFAAADPATATKKQVMSRIFGPKPSSTGGKGGKGGKSGITVERVVKSSGEKPSEVLDESASRHYPPPRRRRINRRDRGSGSRPIILCRIFLTSEDMDSLQRSLARQCERRNWSKDNSRHRLRRPSGESVSSAASRSSRSSSQRRRRREDKEKDSFKKMKISTERDGGGYFDPATTGASSQELPPPQQPCMIQPSPQEEYRGVHDMVKKEDLEGWPHNLGGTSSSLMPPPTKTSSYEEEAAAAAAAAAASTASSENSGDLNTYMLEATRLKHEADREHAPERQATKYLRAVLYFILCGNLNESTGDKSAAFKMYKDTLSLIK